ncbi:DEAD/DEAH box helicase [Clostridium botulinum]|nr:DEAD/DEAH box helicase [Clostridium botulinum]
MGNKNFENLNLSEDVLKAIQHMGFETPSEIQEKSIPVVLEGTDVIAQAQTGTGKTLAFGAPVISSLPEAGKKKGVKALVLTPTRELALQIKDELKRLSKYSKAKVLPVYGGESIERQIKDIKSGVDIVVGTPGRVLDHINRRTLKLGGIDFLILDEADEMLNMGFIDDIETIMASTPEEKQTMLFSATMPQTIKKLALNYMKEDVEHIAVLKKSLTVDKIVQCYFSVKNKDKLEALCRIIDLEEPESAIIFCRTKRGVDELVEAMQLKGYNVEGMHGDMSQNQRINTLKKFKKATLNFLVATDVAARGIDVQNISHVINYDIPQDAESYVHRIGRTGRADKEGTAYSLVTPREVSSIRQIERITKSKIKKKELPTLEDILEKKYDNLLDNITSKIKEKNYEKFMPMAKTLEQNFDLVDVSAALMEMVFSKQMSFDYTNNKLEAEVPVRLFLSVGRKDSINVKSLLTFIQDTASVKKHEVGDIDILDKFTFMDVSSNTAQKIINKCSGEKLNRRKVNIEIAKSKK